MPIREMLIPQCLLQRYETGVMECKGEGVSFSHGTGELANVSYGVVTQVELLIGVEMLW